MNDADLSRVMSKLEKMDREQVGIAASQRHMTSKMLELTDTTNKIQDSLNGPKGLVAQVGLISWVQEHCTARLRADAEATTPGGPHQGREALSREDAHKLLASLPRDSVPPNRVKVAREKTKQERLRLARIIATVVGLLACGGAGGAGLLQLLTPAQASQPAAAHAP